jgi:hypothetical protein
MDVSQQATALIFYRMSYTSSGRRFSPSHIKRGRNRNMLQLIWAYKSHSTQISAMEIIG